MGNPGEDRLYGDAGDDTLRGGNDAGLVGGYCRSSGVSPVRRLVRVSILGPISSRS